MKIRKVILVVLDSVGVGAMADAADFLDEGANTLAHTAEAVGGLCVPNLAGLGLGNIVAVEGVEPAEAPLASFGRMAEASPAKDTVTGHWELAGLESPSPFAVYEHGFPREIVDAFERTSGFKTLFNKPSSGTVIIEQLGREHMETGALILYTSADSVFQLAAHEEVVPVEALYRACEAARKVLDPYRVARVIARPFVGRPGSFQRTYNRKDFCMAPHGDTLLDLLSARGLPVVGVGKIHDIFAGRGLTASIHTEGNRDGMEQTLRLNRSVSEGLIFVNLVDFDMVYGHRRNATGYAAALVEADEHLGRLLPEVDQETALILTADHGCDPTHMSHTDHTREYVPVLLYSPSLPAGRALGTRSTFADVAATVSRLLGVPLPSAGTSLV